MPVNVVAVGKKNPQSPGDPEKYYSQTKSNGDVDLRQLSEQIADISTVSSIDTMAVLEALVKVVPQNIADGRIVRLGDFGNFRLSVSSTGVEKVEDVTVVNITTNRMHFRPGKEVQKVLNNIEYKKTA